MVQPKEWLMTQEERNQVSHHNGDLFTSDHLDP
jgi:hypothetical protein